MEITQFLNKIEFRNINLSSFLQFIFKKRNNLSVFLMFLFLFQACNIKEVVPKAAFTYEIKKDGEVYFFSNSENAVSVKWFFGDGETSTEMNPIHRFKEPNKYSVKLVAISQNQQNELIREINVNDFIPSIEFEISKSGQGEISISSKILNADEISWDLGDNYGKSQERTFKYSYFKNGTFNITCLAKNATNESKLVKTITIDDAKEYVLIPDEVFEKKLIEKYFDSEQRMDGKILKSDAENVEELSIYDTKNLIGIEAFINLKKLSCCTTGVDSLDLSKNTKLEIFDCGAYGGSNLKYLNIKSNLKLKDLVVYYTELKEIDISKNINLDRLVIHVNGFQNNLRLNTSNNTKLSGIFIYGDKIESLNLTNNINLTSLQIYSTNNTLLKNLDLSKNTILYGIHLHGLQAIERLDISKITKLVILDTKNNKNLKEICVSSLVQEKAVPIWFVDNWSVAKVCN